MSAAAITAQKSAPVRRGFPGLRCPLCGEEGTISLDLDTLDLFHCGSNDCEISLDDIKAMLASWNAVLDWVALAPLIAE